MKHCWSSRCIWLLPRKNSQRGQLHCAVPGSAVELLNGRMAQALFVSVVEESQTVEWVCYACPRPTTSPAIIYIGRLKMWHLPL